MTTTDTTPMEHQLRADIGNRTDIIRRRPDLTHMHLPATLDLIVTHLASLEQGVEDANEATKYTGRAILAALTAITDRLDMLEERLERQEGDGR